MKINMNHSGNGGYAPDQVNGMTLGALLEAVQEAIVEWGEDAEVVLHQVNNQYGASYGSFCEYEIFTNDNDEGQGD